MRRQIKLTTRRDLTAAISRRYQAADRNGKKLILDEFVKLTSYHRKHHRQRKRLIRQVAVRMSIELLRNGF
jgi:hypothetical protein